ncbi:MAG: hypothetical protein J6L89_08315 [Clostridia bacterium]|nr:hypothetical protein [Clostridia bacterium]
MSYTNIITEFKKVRLIKLWQIELLLLGCGFFWEYITPLFRKETVSDMWDIAAYMLGGVIYWAVNKVYEKVANTK